MLFFQLTSLQKRNLYKVVSFTFIWSCSALAYAIIQKGILGDSKVFPATNNPYAFINSFITSQVAAISLGILFGILEVMFFFKFFSKVSFVKKLISKILIYTTIIFILTSSIIFVAISFSIDLSLNDPRVLDFYIPYITSFAFWSVFIFIIFTVIISLFFLEVSDYLGQGVLKNFLTGKYHQPREEKRIFMFLDMKSSTTIAEKLGHIKYYQLLNEYYADITKAILKTSGEIYQYVGDEIIISWELEKGIQQNNCLSCFFMIKKIFSEVSGKYMKEYGLVPGFKAGVHYGHVTTGEIGVIKKEIVFTGDVLNTTSRIQGLCNTYETDILISNDLVSKLNIEVSYELKEIGEIELRGKNEKVKLSTVKVMN